MLRGTGEGKKMGQYVSTSINGEGAGGKKTTHLKVRIRTRSSAVARKKKRIRSLTGDEEGRGRKRRNGIIKLRHKSAQLPGWVGGGGPKGEVHRTYRKGGSKKSWTPAKRAHGGGGFGKRKEIICP